MMMNALKNGGMPVMYDDEPEKLNIDYGRKGYLPNPNGFFELSRENMNAKDFPIAYDNYCVKALYGALYFFPAHTNNQYKILFMKRNPMDIKNSLMSFFKWKDDKLVPKLVEDYEFAMSRIIDICKIRKDMDLNVFRYEEVLQDPLSHFKKLKDSGWDIDVDKASKTIDLNLHRHNIEQMFVGGPA